MKNNLKKIIILGLTIGILNANGYINNSNMESEIDRLSTQINAIYNRSQKHLQITNKFKEIANKHYILIQSVTDSRAMCDNEKMKYQEINSGNSIVKKFQAKNLKKCYQNQNKRIINFERIDRSFKKLDEKISVLNELSESEQVVYARVKQELSIQRDMLESYKAQVNSGLNNLTSTIKDY